MARKPRRIWDSEGIDQWLDGGPAALVNRTRFSSATPRPTSGLPLFCARKLKPLVQLRFATTGTFWVATTFLKKFEDKSSSPRKWWFSSRHSRSADSG